MPRLQPPSGYITSKQAQERLEISETMLRNYVREGRLNKYGPVGRTYRPWYREEEIEALYHAERMLEPAHYVKGSYKRNPTTSFELAREEDMPAIIDIDTRTFKHPAASLDVCLTWLRKNPHTFYVLKNDEGVVRAYASLIPMDKALIDKFVRNELDGDNITAEMISDYVAGKSVDIYVMAIAVSPDCSENERNTYGYHIILGLFRFLLGLASEGVDVRTITARNYMGKDGLKLKDGLHLLRKMGFTQIKSSVAGVGLFVVNVPESGIGIFEKYSAALEKWKSEHEGRCA